MLNLVKIKVCTNESNPQYRIIIQCSGVDSSARTPSSVMTVMRAVDEYDLSLMSMICSSTG